MPEYDSLKEILGKTITGVIVKKNTKNDVPAISVHLVFSDDTFYEIYSLYQMSFAGGVYPWDMDKVRKYGTGSTGPMKNVLDITFDED